MKTIRKHFAKAVAANTYLNLEKMLVSKDKELFSGSRKTREVLLQIIISNDILFSKIKNICFVYTCLIPKLQRMLRIMFILTTSYSV